MFDWLDIISATPCQHLIFDADIGEIDKLLDNPAAIKTWRSRILIALPPFIGEGQLKFWRGVAERCLSAGLWSFTMSNLGHFPIVKGAKRLVADAPLWCLNRFTQKELEARGVSEFVISYEDEYLNIRNATDWVWISDTHGSGNHTTIVEKAKNHSGNHTEMAGIRGIAPVYGKPPLFISRVPPGINRDTVVTDPHGGRFSVHAKNGLCYTLPETPVCLFAKRKKLSECGIERFLIDLCFHTPGYEIVNKLISGFRRGVRVENSAIFNFKAGLR
jgi:putative protease